MTPLQRFIINNWRKQQAHTDDDFARYPSYWHYLQEYPHWPSIIKRINHEPL